MTVTVVSLCAVFGNWLLALSKGFSRKLMAPKILYKVKPDMMSFLIVSSMFLFSVSISAFVILPSFHSFPDHALFRSDIGSLKNSDTDVNELDDSDLDEIISLLESGEDLESLLLDNFWEEDPEGSSFDSSNKEKKSAHTDPNPMIDTFHRLIENRHEKHDNETAQNVETALFRILDEYEREMQAQDDSKLTIIEPQADHFLSVSTSVGSSSFHSISPLLISLSKGYASLD
jgi:hypothetical protein